MACKKIVATHQGVWATTDSDESSLILGITYDSLQFKFPHAQKRMLGDHVHSFPTTLFTKDLNAYSANAVVNCSFTGAESDPVLRIKSVGIFMDNNEFIWNDWSAGAKVKFECACARAHLRVVRAPADSD